MNSNIKAFTLLIGLFWMVSMAQARELTDIQVENESNGVRFILNLDSEPGNPSVFTTEQPPRIVLELPDTTSDVDASRVPVGAGPARSYTALSAGGRTRLVVDMSRSAPYEVQVSGNRVELMIQGGGSGTTASAMTEAGSQTSGSESMEYEVQGIDFRRGPDGESRVLVDIDDPGVNLSVDERTGGLRVDLFNTELPPNLYRRLDVTDFATPVQMITPEQRGSNVRLNLEISGAYQHLAYQSGGQVVIEVGRPEQEAPQDRELTFFEEREYDGNRITLNFQDIPVRSVLALIADVSDLNIVVSDSVSGNLTLRLTNVPWDQALDIVLETKNLDMRRSGNVIWIAPTAEIAAREQSILQARAERQTLEPLRTAIIPLSYADAGEMAALVQAASQGAGSEEDGGGTTGLLSPRGSVTIDQRTNTLLVNDTADRIDAVRELVTDLDRPVRQVLIESRIVIARNDFNHQLGVRFGVSGARQDSRGNLYTMAASSEGANQMVQDGLANRRSGTGSSTPVNPPGLGDRLNVNLPVANPAGSLGFSVLAADMLLDLELSALESEGRGEIISTPRVITANQAEAYVLQGVEIPYESVQGGATAGAINVEFKEAVLELRATPLITPDNRIQLQLQVKQDTVGELFPNGRGGFIPSIDTRELSTRILIDNGQTVVLGGIFQEERTYQEQKVPVLGDVPVIGGLFRQRGTEEEKRELLIFVTPSILDERVAAD